MLHTIQILLVYLKDLIDFVYKLLDSWLSIFNKSMAIICTKKEGNYPIFRAVYRTLQEGIPQKCFAKSSIKKVLRLFRGLNRFTAEVEIFIKTLYERLFLNLLTKKHLLKFGKKVMNKFPSFFTETKIRRKKQIKKAVTTLFFVRFTAFNRTVNRILAYGSPHFECGKPPIS
jgi:hypothetical protein